MSALPVILGKKNAENFLLQKLMQDEAITTQQDAERIIKEWKAGGVLAPADGDALLRSVAQTQIAIMKGKIIV